MFVILVHLVNPNKYQPFGKFHLLITTKYSIQLQHTIYMQLQLNNYKSPRMYDKSWPLYEIQEKLIKG